MAQARKVAATKHGDALSTLGAGGLVVWRSKVLLVQMGYGVARGKWILPGGMVMPGESPEDAACREVFEETGVRTTVRGLVSVRHRPFEERSGLRLANVYFVFRLDPTAQSERLLVREQFKVQTSEVLAAKLWGIRDALKSPDVRPMTRLILKMLASDDQWERATLPAKMPGILPAHKKDSIYGPRKRARNAPRVHARRDSTQLNFRRRKTPLERSGLSEKRVGYGF